MKNVNPFTNHQKYLWPHRPQAAQGGRCGNGTAIAAQAGTATDYIITTGDVHFDDLEPSEFTPLRWPYSDSWFEPTNPTPYLQSKTTFITEWYKLPVPVSINEELYIENSNLIYYPNPTSGFLYLKSGPALTYNVRLYDSRGLLINEWVNITDSKVIDMQLFPSGLYYLVANYENSFSVSKIIKL